MDWIFQPELWKRVAWGLLIGLLLVASPWLVRWWRRLRPMTRCLVLSVLAHVGLVLLLAQWQWPHPGPGGPGRIRLVSLDAVAWLQPEQRETDTEQSVAQPRVSSSDRPTWNATLDDPRPLADSPEESSPPASLSEPEPIEGPADVPDRREDPAERSDVVDDDVVPPAPAADEPAAEADGTTDRPLPDAVQATAQPGSADSGVVPSEPPPAEPDQPGSFAATGSTPPAPHPAGVNTTPRSQVASPLYSGRISTDRMALVRSAGGDERTEAAVAAALAWLASVQQADGRWNPARFGGGLAVDEPGSNRHQAGLRADTGVSGLVILSLLAAGHTHREGAHRHTVHRGIAYLLSQQDAEGSLAGRAGAVEAMYCHGMAALALSEVYGMTGDAALRAPLERALRYSRSRQHPSTGGWRYHLGDPGDTSQLGWQLMALYSARQAGLWVPDEVFRRSEVFLGTVSSGRARGLASYRLGHPPSRAMTAEALLCRLMLERLSREQMDESVAYLLQELPGEGESNFYYWYYASLALYQLQGPAWERWNEALKGHLLRTQRRDGAWAGSWDPDCRWGAHGGRLYSTAMATLSLEVYYRYLPFSNHLARWAAEQPNLR